MKVLVKWGIAGAAAVVVAVGATLMVGGRVAAVQTINVQRGAIV